jgi:hypothetical protein
MTTRPSDRLMLRGSKVQYSDGKIESPRLFDLDNVLTKYARLPDAERLAFLSVFSHSLTVDMRAALLDRPVSEANARRAWQLNEWLHHLTSCFNPRSSWGIKGEAQLLRDIATDSFRHGLDGAVGRGIATAAGSTGISANKHAAAQD